MSLMPISALLLGHPWKTPRHSWPLWWAVGLLELCWPALSFSPCITAQIPILKTGRYSSRTRQHRDSGRWASIRIKTEHKKKSCKQTGVIMGSFLFWKQNMNWILVYTQKKRERGRKCMRWREGGREMVPECSIYWWVGTKKMVVKHLLTPRGKYIWESYTSPCWNIHTMF